MARPFEVALGGITREEPGDSTRRHRDNPFAQHVSQRRDVVGEHEQPDVGLDRRRRGRSPSYSFQPVVAPFNMAKGPTGQLKQSTIAPGWNEQLPGGSRTH